MLYDAEEVGLMLRNILKPVDPNGDFQDYSMWRALTVDIANRLHRAYGRTLIMPMTIWKENYFTEVISGLGNFDKEIYHFCLTAPLEAIRERIFQRSEQQEGDWIFDQIEKCVAAFNSDIFEEKLIALACHQKKLRLRLFLESNPEHQGERIDLSPEFSVVIWFSLLQLCESISSVAFP